MSERDYYKRDKANKSAKIRRTRDDILEDILYCCFKPIKRMEISDKALLDLPQVDELLHVLIGQGLVEVLDEKTETKFVITVLGRRFYEASRRNNRLSGIIKF